MTRLVAALLALLSGAVSAEGTRILLLRPSGSTFEEAKHGLVESLGAGYEVDEITVSRSTSPREILGAWKAASPRAVVAMDNRAVALVREVRERLADTATPLVAMMGVRLDLAMSGLPNSAAIEYEIPVVTGLLHLRSILPAPISRAAFVYRASWDDLFRRNADFCRMEGIELVGWRIPEGADPSEAVRSALREIVHDRSIDALVVPNDNVLLNADLLRRTWVPARAGWRRPVVVGVESLVLPQARLGDFAVLPDHYALGAQAADLLKGIEESDWRIGGRAVEQPLSVLKIVNRRGMDACCTLREDRRGEIDKELR